MFSKKSGKETNGEPPQTVVNFMSQTKSNDSSNTASHPSQFGGGMSTVPSIIGTDLSITGNIVSKGEIQVDGEIQGDIHCASLIIGEKALISGGVVAEDIVVRGKVMGSLRGLRVTLQASSHVEGDVFHQSIAIEQGAFFEGKSRRSDDPIGTAPKVGTTESTSRSTKNESAAEKKSAASHASSLPTTG